jgi:hypothetical protein
LKQRQRRIEPPAFELNFAQTMQRIEAVGMLRQRLAAKPLRLAKLALRASPPRALERALRICWRRRR